MRSRSTAVLGGEPRAWLRFLRGYRHEARGFGSSVQLRSATEEFRGWEKHWLS
jgi:hypothetical protein